jgi:hypothetical protein
MDELGVEPRVLRFHAGQPMLEIDDRIVQMTGPQSFAHYFVHRVSSALIVSQPRAGSPASPAVPPPGNCSGLQAAMKTSENKLFAPGRLA